LEQALGFNATPHKSVKGEEKGQFRRARTRGANMRYKERERVHREHASTKHVSKRRRTQASAGGKRGVGASISFFWPDVSSPVRAAWC